MRISIIVAMDEQGVIGADNRLPWHLSADLKNFKALTMGKPIVMGRKTHESIGRPLPGRENIVITRDKNYAAPGCTVLHGLDEVLAHCAHEEEVMITGGADLYRQALPRASRIYLTQVHTRIKGDTVFPEFNRNDWREIEKQDFKADEKNEFDYSFVVLERR